MKKNILNKNTCNNWINNQTAVDIWSLDTWPLFSFPTRCFVFKYGHIDRKLSQRPAACRPRKINSFNYRNENALKQHSGFDVNHTFTKAVRKREILNKTCTSSDCV